MLKQLYSKGKMMKVNDHLNALVKLMLACLALMLAVPSFAEDAYQKTINNFKQSPVARNFFNSSYAYAVFPTIGKAGIGIGGARGKGRVYRAGKVVGSATMTQLSVGFQLGAQAYSQVVFFQDKRAYSEFTSGNFEFGAGASAIAVNASAEVKAGSSGASASAGLHPSETEQLETKYFKGMAVLTAGKGGLMYEASISGQKYQFKKN